jgi:ATP-dependent Lhr-like helicase
VGTLRDTRRADSSGALVGVSGADPLNLVGIVVPGPRVPALASNRVLYRDGAAAGVLVSAEPRILEQVPSPQQWELTNLLMRSHAPASLARLLH